jgi:O-antigen/teichoic acid export membrane protein
VKQLLNGAITVTTPRLTNLFVKDKYAYLVLLEKIVNTLIVLILPAAAGLTALCMPIITVFAGNSYMEGALALAILAMALLFSIFANVFFQGILMPKRMEKTITRVAIISALVNIILNLLLIPIYQQNAAAFTTLIAEIIVFLFGLVYGKDELCLIEWKKTFCHATSATATFILYLAIMNHIHIFSSSGILLLAVNIPVCVFIYCFIMFTLKDEHFLYFINAVVIQVINNVKKERNYK